MNKTLRPILLLLCVGTLAGCAVGKEMGWHRDAPPTEVVATNCEAATATLKERPDHDISYRACVAAKTRQGVD